MKCRGSSDGWVYGLGLGLGLVVLQRRKSEYKYLYLPAITPLNASGGLCDPEDWQEACGTRPPRHVCVCVCVFARLDCSASLIQFHFDFGISDLPMPMAAQIANQIVGQIFNRVNMFMPNQAISFKHTPHDEALVPPPLCVCV